MKLFATLLSLTLLTSSYAFSSTKLLCEHKSRSRVYSALVISVELSDDHNTVKMEVLRSGRGDVYSPMKGESAVIERHESGKGWINFETPNSWDPNTRSFSININEERLKQDELEVSMAFSKKGYTGVQVSYGMTCYKQKP